MEALYEQLVCQVEPIIGKEQVSLLRRIMEVVNPRISNYTNAEYTALFMRACSFVKTAFTTKLSAHEAALIETITKKLTEKN